MLLPPPLDPASTAAAPIIAHGAPRLARRAPKTTVAFVDLETTGLDPSRHDIIELGIIRVDARTLEVLDEHEALVAPERLGEAQLDVLAINGFTTAAWEHALPLREALLEVAPLLDGALVAGHNVGFDWAFLETGFRRTGLTLPNVDVHFVQGLDVIDIAVLANAFEGKFAGEPDLVEAKRGPGAGVKSFGVGLAKVAAALLFSGVEGVEGVDGAEKGAQGGGIVAGFDLGFEHAEAVEVFDGGRVKLEGFADPQAKAFAQGFAVQGGFLLAAKARQCKGGVVVKVGHARGAAVRRLQLESALAQSEGLTGTLQVAEGEDDFVHEFKPGEVPVGGKARSEGGDGSKIASAFVLES